ncbi:MAG: hypothetical protein HS111_11780 [Kofleriaceae bacterium]|nr:hypothetical protein [Kofleriaceae bacterium]MCL4227317.1 hypothetical protein [Myxococcales bacterium]
MECSRSVLVAAFAVTTLVATGSDAGADITYAGTGTYTSGGYSYYETYASNADECYAMGGTPICESGPTIERQSGSGSLKGLVATPTTGLDPGTGAPGGPTTSARLLPEDGCQTTRCRMTTYTPPKYKYARTDDIMVWKNASPTSAAGKLQAVAFNGYAAHAGICYSADSGGCAYVYENNANDPDAEKQCSPACSRPAAWPRGRSSRSPGSPPAATDAAPPVAS